MTKNESRAEQIKHAWSILSRSSSTDHDTKVVSFFNVLERVNLNATRMAEARRQQDKEYVNVPFGFELTSLWWREEGGVDVKAGFKIGLVDPDERVLYIKEYPLTFDQDKKRIRIRVKINDLQVGPGGIYRFRVYFKGVNKDRFQTVAELPLEVALVEPKPVDQN